MMLTKTASCPKSNLANSLHKWYNDLAKVAHKVAPDLAAVVSDALVDVQGNRAPANRGLVVEAAGEDVDEEAQAKVLAAPVALLAVVANVPVVLNQITVMHPSKS